MKYTIVLSIVMTLSSCADATSKKGNTMSEQVKEDGNYYEDYSFISFSGIPLEDRSRVKAPYIYTYKNDEGLLTFEINQRKRPTKTVKIDKNSKNEYFSVEISKSSKNGLAEYMVSFYVDAKIKRFLLFKESGNGSNYSLMYVQVLYPVGEGKQQEQTYTFFKPIVIENLDNLSFNDDYLAESTKYETTLYEYRFSDESISKYYKGENGWKIESQVPRQNIIDASSLLLDI